ncbi:MAG: L-rhamnose catabolism isomerase [Geminicoccaceae bacterium]|nr:L-rhamnose catabolism isomerase [Geminicoccaceae bacterium]
MSEFTIDSTMIDEGNRPLLDDHRAEFDALGSILARRGHDIDRLIERIAAFTVAVPSWGVGTGGTRFGRFPGPGEPRSIFEKIDDCAAIQSLVRSTPTVSPHIPWDRCDDYPGLVEHARARGLSFDAVNSNTFQDQPGQELSYKFGSLCHSDPATRKQAIEHNIECIGIGRKLGSKALTVWIADGSNFPGQQDLTGAFDRYLASMQEIYAALPDGWQVFLEHKFYEPAFYSTVIADWGSSFMAASELGPKAKCLVDLGHHAANVNIEQIVARLVRFGKLAGFHFNDSKYGDDDLDAGSINPFQLFLVFHELVLAGERRADGFEPAYMIDQSHNVTDPVESLMDSAMAIQRAHAQALLVDRHQLGAAQDANDTIGARDILMRAFRCDVSPLIAEARLRSGGALDPIRTFRATGYRQKKDAERPQQASFGGGIV